MEVDLGKKASDAFVDDNFERAVELYTQALDMDPNNALIFADRAQANIKLNSYTEAVADATRAIELDPLMSKAYLRKGTACLKLEEYHTAKAALEAGVVLAPGDKRFINLIKDCDKCITEETNDLPNNVLPIAPPSTTTASPGSHSPDVNAEAIKDFGSGHDSSRQSMVVKPTIPKYR